MAPGTLTRPGWLAFGLLLLLLAGCAAKPPRPAADGSFRVDTTPDPGYRMTHDGRLRSYFLHLPKGYNARRRYPLLLVLHGGMGSGALIAERTGFNQLADREGFIAVYPNGSGWSELSMLTWNAGHCCFYARDHAVDDVGFVDALLDRLQRDYAIDPARIYATGFSNGGMLAYTLAARLSRRLAAVAVVSGNMGGREFSGGPLIMPPQPAAPVSVLAIHGLVDQQVAYAGGRGERTVGTRIDSSVAEAVTFWRQANGCSEAPQRQSLAGGEVSVQRYSCPDSGTQVQLYTLQTGGHAWPGGEQVAGWRAEQVAVRMLLDSPSDAIDASELIWQFFSTQRKPIKAMPVGRPSRWRLSTGF